MSSTNTTIESYSGEKDMFYSFKMEMHDNSNTMP
jgi:hypothetical protein